MHANLKVNARFDSELFVECSLLKVGLWLFALYFISRDQWKCFLNSPKVFCSCRTALRLLVVCCRLSLTKSVYMEVAHRSHF